MACSYFTLAESLGGVESLVAHPGHDDPRGDDAGGARGGRHLRRPAALSVGIEAADDLLADLARRCDRALSCRRTNARPPP
jgi:cystathionine gamma-synthase